MTEMTRVTPIRETLTGTFTREQIERLSWPVAVGAGVRESDLTAGLAELLDEAREIFDGPDPVKSVWIQYGQLIGVNLYSDEEMES